MKRIKLFINNTYIYTLSFAIPFVILLILFKESHIYPFGDYSHLDGDMYTQYLPFLQNLRNAMLNGADFNYAWDLGLGSGYGALYAYYLASPLNILVILVSPEHMIDFMNLLILIKLPLCGVSFAYYLRKKFNRIDLLIPTVSICYALCAYMCNYCSNIMWLDGLLLFPLIILGVEKLYNEKKYKLYFFSLFLAILSNYYIGIIICIYLMIYFTAMVLFNEGNKTIKESLNCIHTFVIYSLLAGLATFAVTLPAVCALSNTSSGEFSFPKYVEFYISIQDMMIRPLILAPKSGTDIFPNLFCSVIVLLIMPAYLFNGKINIKRKIKYIILTSFMIISFNCNILDYIWHGFHFPNCLVARNSFVYVLLILTITYEGILKIKDLKDKYYLLSIIISVAYIIFVWKSQINNPDATTVYKEAIVYLSLFFLTMYTIFMTMLRGISQKRLIPVYILLLCCISYELYMNDGAFLGSTHTRSHIVKQDNEIAEISKNLISKDKSFYRMETTIPEIMFNVGAMNRYSNASYYSSTANAGVPALYACLGLNNFNNLYSTDGSISLINSLFDVKYLIGYNDNGSLYATENDYVFSLGFMISDDFESSVDSDEENPFVNLNNMYSSLSGDIASLYDFANVSKSDGQRVFTAEADGEYYIMCPDNPDYLEITTIAPNGTTNTQSINYSTNSHISDIGLLEAGTIVSVTASTDGETMDDITIYAAKSNDGLIKNCYDNLKDGFLSIDNIDGDGVSGTIDAGDGGIMFTSIPADNGWTAYVDGKEVSIHAFKDAFISLELDAGEHEIVLKYKTPGRSAGVIISVLALSAFAVLELYKYHASRHNR